MDFLFSRLISSAFYFHPRIYFYTQLCNYAFFLSSMKDQSDNRIFSGWLYALRIFQKQLGAKYSIPIKSAFVCHYFFEVQPIELAQLPCSGRYGVIGATSLNRLSKTVQAVLATTIKHV